MIKIGMIIGERYEIMEKIGTGGMSDVYKAKCHKLNRFVAVKVLKQEFSENANFVSKFRIEAQAAAGLMHPNIVNVYDVGEENGIHYIVMELVEGITLKKYIEKKARLSYKEAVSIGIQVSMGIEAAHNNHIIHRDIKPQNIIISKDGKVKVTDFGIAKAATSNTITSNVMGSVHYTSPEQARGGYSDEKSDIYSLGISLFEMLTGRVPFNGETTVAIAIKHIQEELPSPKEYVPEIPVSVESIVIKCCQKSPDRRYQNIAELIQDLKQSLISPDGDFVVMDTPITDGSTRMVSDDDMVRIKRNSGRKEGSGRAAKEQNQAERHTGDLYEEDEEYDDDSDEMYEDDEEEDYDPKMERISTVLAIIAGVIILCIIIFLVAKVFSGSGFGNDSSPISTTTEDSEEESSQTVEKEPEEVSMPDVTGWNVEDAKKELVRLKLIPETVYEESEEHEEDTVISSDIDAGVRIKEGTKVVLTVSSGTQAVTVPTVTGKTYEEAYAELDNAGFLIKREEEPSASTAKGRVIRQSPGGSEKVPEGSTITLIVSLGEEENKILVPNLIGLAEDEATIALIEKGLVLKSVSEVYNSEVAAGRVCYQSYSQGTYVDMGTPIEIRISMGSENITYKYNGSITAPTTDEAPEYTTGTAVTLKLVTDAGQTLLETTVSSFPQSANYHGISSSGGTLYFNYSVTTQSTTQTNPDTGETITVPGETQVKSFTRKVEFTKE